MAKGARRIVTVRFVSPGVSFEGSSASMVRTDKVGRHMAVEVTEEATGVVLSKGSACVRVPWGRVLAVEYTDA